ncbi:hypothetical protein F5Y06DRAFT_276299 [Hypoxylon sp. FL0890]|nr:hypothetical protein F5Y06DRAFT_276299 [Hypoxylon sp. FL0890]
MVPRSSEQCRLVGLVVACLRASAAMSPASFTRDENPSCRMFPSGMLIPGTIPEPVASVPAIMGCRHYVMAGRSLRRCYNPCPWNWYVP